MFTYLLAGMASTRRDRANRRSFSATSAEPVAAGKRCRARTVQRPNRRRWNRTSSWTSCCRPGRRPGCRSAGIRTVAACRTGRHRRRTIVGTPRQRQRRPRPPPPRTTTTTTTWWLGTANSSAGTMPAWRTGDGGRTSAVRRNCCTAVGHRLYRWCICRLAGHRRHRHRRRRNNRRG